jgi:TetR/AcrR family transcriptional repressor of nem operon
MTAALATMPHPEPDTRARTKGQATRQAILTAAARAIREQGPDRISVVAVMRAAGLTHGGFYAHFESKEALVAEAIAMMFAGGRDRFIARIGARRGAEALKTWIDAYVSRSHRDAPGGGCALSALMSDVARLDAAARAAFDDGLRGIAARLARHLPPQVEQPETVVTSLLAEMAGAVALARAVGDPQLSDRILKTSRASLKARIDSMAAA